MSSTTATSALASATSATASSSVSNHGSGFAALFGNVNPLIPAALIVALLAIVVSSLTMWNRIVQRRLALQRGELIEVEGDGPWLLRTLLISTSGVGISGENARRIRRDVDFGEKPRLWDVWIPPTQEREEAGAWKEMLPFAASTRGHRPSRDSTPSHTTRIGVVVVMPSQNVSYHPARELDPKEDMKRRRLDGEREYVIGVVDVPVSRQSSAL